MSFERKISEKYENPIDNLMLHISNKLNSMFDKIGYMANGIKTLSIFFDLAAL